jgi:hypothetical protein
MVFSVVFDEAEVVVVTDPDIMANHGIARGANADLWLAIIGQLLPEGGTVVFDETIHGLVAPRHLLVALTRPPLMLVGVQLVLLLCALLWAGNARFGGLLPREAALGLGKGGLIDNIANLHAFAGHGVYNLRRYLDTMVHDVAARLGAPVEGDQQRGVLARREELLGIGGTLQRLRNDAGRLEGAGSGRSAARLVAVARSIHQWHEEMLDGPGTSA